MTVESAAKVKAKKIPSPSKSNSFWLGLTLSNPKAINALTHEMILELKSHFTLAAQDPQILGIFFDGDGEKGFCAGGDVRTLASRVTKNPLQAAQFFKDEYEFDYQVHLFPKPLVIWGHGVVMGGGFGIFQGASFRLLTTDSKVAMPELAIGLFPDVGATFFLGTLPKKLGLFLGLTGARLTPRDCAELGLCEGIFEPSHKEKFLESLIAATSFEEVFQCVDAQKIQNLDNLPFNQELFTVVPSLLENASSLNELDAHWRTLLHRKPNPLSDWLKNALDNYFQGCPFSAAITFRQMTYEASRLSLRDCFLLEGRLMPALAARSDFMEGVRARLIDKDNKPQWSPQNLNSLEASQVSEIFNVAHLKKLGIEWELNLPEEIYGTKIPAPWKKCDAHSIKATFKFKNHVEAFAAMQSISELAEKSNHHPEWTNVYNRLDIRLTTHDAAPRVGGKLTLKDIHLAKKISDLIPF